MNLTSCTVLLPAINRANNEVIPNKLMDVIKNKSDAMKYWGVPQKIVNFEGIEIWYYDLSNYEMSGVKYSHVEFHFQGDKVVNWRTNVVDLSGKNLTQSFLVGFLIDCFLIGIALGLYAGS